MVCRNHDAIHHAVIIGIFKIGDDHIHRFQIIENEVAITVDDRITKITFKNTGQNRITVEELQISSHFIKLIL